MKLLLVIPGFGDPQIELKRKWLIHNINKISTTFTGTIDIKIFNYGTVKSNVEELYPQIHIEECMEKGYIGQFIYKYIKPELVDTYDYIIMLLDDIELHNDFNLDFIIKQQKYYNFDIISPSLIYGSAWSHWCMMQNASPDSPSKILNVIRDVNFIELFCYIMTPLSYKKWYSLLDDTVAWLWGIDTAIGCHGFKCALLDNIPMKHHIKGSAYNSSAPNPYDEYGRNRHRLGHVSGYSKENPNKYLEFI